MKKTYLAVAIACLASLSVSAAGAQPSHQRQQSATPQRAAITAVLKSYQRLPRVTWSENNCTEGNYNIAIGNEVYLLAGDGRLMPIKKDQPAPDLYYFKQAPK